MESPGRHKILEKSVISLVHIMNSSLGVGGEDKCVASKGKTGLQIQGDRGEEYKVGLGEQGFRTNQR